MMAFLRKLVGIEADAAVRERNLKLQVLEHQGRELEILAEQMKVARAASAARVKTGVRERDNLERSRAGEHRLKLDSVTDK
jgi:hypothetical protein